MVNSNTIVAKIKASGDKLILDASNVEISNNLVVNANTTTKTLIVHDTLKFYNKNQEGNNFQSSNTIINSSESFNNLVVNGDASFNKDVEISNNLLVKGYVSVIDSINMGNRAKILFNSTKNDDSNEIRDDIIFKFFTTPIGEAAGGHYNDNQPEALYIRVYNTNINFVSLSTKGVPWLVHSDNLMGDTVGAVQLMSRKLELKDKDGFGAVLQGFNNGNSDACDEFNITMEGVIVLRITRFPTREGTYNNSRGFTQIHIAGHVNAYTNYLTSDDRLKHNEEALTGRSLAVVRQLQPQVYDKARSLNDPTNTIREAGFIAQHVEQIPELVNAGAVHVGTDEELFSLNYNSIFTYAVAATKELDAIVQNQENEITSLKNKNFILENEINTIKEDNSLLKEENSLIKSKLNELLSESGKETINF